MSTQTQTYTHYSLFTSKPPINASHISWSVKVFILANMHITLNEWFKCFIAVLIHLRLMKAFCTVSFTSNRCSAQKLLRILNQVRANWPSYIIYSHSQTCSKELLLKHGMQNTHCLEFIYMKEIDVDILELYRLRYVCHNFPCTQFYSQKNMKSYKYSPKLCFVWATVSSFNHFLFSSCTSHSTFYKPKFSKPINYKTISQFGIYFVCLYIFI